MKTEDLVRALAIDAERQPLVPLVRALWLALLPGLAASIVLYAVLIGPRPHLLPLLSEPRVAFKIVFSFALACAASAALLRVMRPDAELRLYNWLFFGLALVLATAVAWELADVPQDLWETRLIGHNAAICLRTIPPLSLAPLIAFFVVARRGAPTRPALAGAVAGLAAGAIGATLYATHCPDDSPLFVATWYGLAIAGVTACAAVAGRRLLRW